MYRAASIILLLFSTLTLSLPSPNAGAPSPGTYNSLSAFGANKRNRFQQRKKRQITNDFVPLTLTAIAPDAPFHNQPINANANNFMIGAPTSSYCPLPAGKGCPPGVETVIRVGRNEGNMLASLPGGQPIYVRQSNYSSYSNLTYTLPHSRTPTTLADYEGFSFTLYPIPRQPNGPVVANATAPVYPAGTLGWFMYYTVQKWLACPAPWFVANRSGGTGGGYGNGTVAAPAWGFWNVLADIPGRPLSEEQRRGCMGLEIQGTVYGGDMGAWEYTKE